MNRTTDDRPIVVLGGTGHYGSRVVKSLKALGARTRVLTRDGNKARQLLGDDLEVVEGDLTDAAALDRALSGCRAMGVCVSAFTPRLVRQLREIEVEGVLRAFGVAEQSAVGRVVLLSVYQPDHPLGRKLGMEISAMKQEVEEALAATSLNWTVLGAPPSLEIFFAFIRGRRMMVPGGGPPALPTVAADDVGEIMAQALVRDDLSQRRFRLSGPDVLSFPEAARRISAVWGVSIKFRKVPLWIPRIAGLLVGPMSPYVRHIVASLRLLNAFPTDLADAAPEDHRRLLDTFEYVPRTLEDEARARCPASRPED